MTRPNQACASLQGDLSTAETAGDWGWWVPFDDVIPIGWDEAASGGYSAATVPARPPELGRSGGPTTCDHGGGATATFDEAMALPEGLTTKELPRAFMAADEAALHCRGRARACRPRDGQCPPP